MYRGEYSSFPLTFWEQLVRGVLIVTVLPNITDCLTFCCCLFVFTFHCGTPPSTARMIFRYCCCLNFVHWLWYETLNHRGWDIFRSHIFSWYHLWNPMSSNTKYLKSRVPRVLTSSQQPFQVDFELFEPAWLCLTNTTVRWLNSTLAYEECKIQIKSKTFTRKFNKNHQVMQ